MAQDEVSESSSSPSASSSGPAARLNAAAPEFTPRSAAQHQSHPHRRGPHNHHHHQPHHHNQHRHQYHHGDDEGDAAGVVERDAQLVLPEDLARRVVKQVEFYFSDVNLATTDHLMRFITKDPDGFVPMSVVATFRKIRELIDRSLLPAALRTSTELVVSDDGKMVRRRVPFSDVDAEEVQARIIVAENLPEDHHYQSLMRIFSAVGSVKSIRTCYPQPQGIGTSGPAAGKSSRIEKLFANKLHAFVEYGTVEAAEKAVAEFSGGRNWRDGPRARSLLGCLKHGLGQGRKGGDEEAADEYDPDTPQDYEAEDMAQAEDGFYDKSGMGRGRGRGRGGRGRGRGQYHGQSRDGGHPIGTPPSNHSAEHPVVPKPPPGPRMPDGTKGFAMGRGKPQLNAA
ncbi:hypothetical protein QYE76_030446 [Lolium multiflorum]|uniref:HTH La-type RNA-binding domain-containing protein n=1 Tax=Lolium multiflorum TaxID=4521 RepID=A0AAD8QPR7_LOLMU|nr:hypothetical protein QYE76_030446 [Lolium multiflorum]